MIALDLLTGFLGAGKTTFLRRYVQYFVKCGVKVCVLENDYGAINTDMLLLQDLRSELCELEMVVGGDGYEAHRRRLRTKLISMAMMGYQRVIMEPSGIFDPDELTDLLCEEPLDQWYRLENVIAIADAAKDTAASEEDAYLTVCQIADAGALVLSKTQFVSAETSAGKVEELNRLLEQYGCRRRFGKEEVFSGDWNSLTDADMEKLASCGHGNYEHVHLQSARENGYASLFYFRLRMDRDEVEHAAERCMRDPACGSIVRIKGAFRTGPEDEPQWFLINATRGRCEITPSHEGQEVLIVIGSGLDKEAVDRYWICEGLSFS